MIRAAVLALLAVLAEGETFAPWVVEEGVEVSIARRAEGAPWVRGVAELPVPAERVFEVLEDYAAYAALLAPVVRRSEVLERLGPAARLHLVWDYPFPFRNRDAIVRYEAERVPGGRFEIRWKDDARPGDPSEGVRIRKVAGETRIEPLGSERCRITYTFLGELGGSFPRAGKEKAWRREPVVYVIALRRALNLPVTRAE